MTAETKTVRTPKPPPTRTLREEAQCHVGMAEMMRERGYPNLAESHIIAAGEAMDQVVAL